MTTSGENVIELCGVGKRFGRQTVLESVDLTVRAGTTLVLTGASGQGKSVIIKLMLGLLKPDGGAVKVFGEDFATLKPAQVDAVRSKFGVLFQNAALFDSMNVFDNVALPIRERTQANEARVREIVREKLDLVDLHDVEDKFPAQLSGGMRKRVGLARALTLDPQVVFFDEPTAGLDVHRSNEIYRLFQDTREKLGYTAVIVSHDVPKVYKLSDEVALLASGRIQAQLAPERFQLSADPVVRAFVETTMGPIYRG